MGITFIQIDDKTSEELNSLSQICKFVKDEKIRENNQLWRKLVLSYIEDLYNNITQSEKEILKTVNERAIKEFIRRKLETNNEFTKTHFLTVELETQNKHPRLLGFYDLKIRSSLWDSYFSFECKCIDHTLSSLKEYVYNPQKSKNGRSYEDGGLYRFIINKYSTDIGFGGMLGFIQKGNFTTIMQNVCNQIENFKINIKGVNYGELDITGIVQTDCKYYFQTTHSRYDLHENRNCMPIEIHHFLFDFSE